MAKGDQKAVRNQIDYSGNQAQANLNNTRARQQMMQQPLFNYWQQGVGTNLANYNTIMNQFHQFMNPQQQQQQPTQDRGGTAPPSSTGQQQAPSNAMPERPNDLRQALETASRVAYGGKPVSDSDVNYWQQMWNKDPDYTFKRMLGWQAGGSDVAQSGPYAGGGGAQPPLNTGDPFYNNILNSMGSGGGPFNSALLGMIGNYGPALDQAIGGYGNFAQTGGFSPQDIQDIRARAIAPIRGIYSQAQDNIERAKRLAGPGGMANYAATQAKAARDEAYGLSDKTTDAEAMIAQMLQQGKLAGLGGLSQTGLGARGQDLSTALGARGQDISGALGARGQNLGAITGQGNLYGTSPGLAQMFGNQLLSSTGQDLAGQQLQQNLAQMLIQGRLGQAQVPGNFQQALGNIGDVLGLIGQGASAFGGLGNIGRLFGIGGGTSGTYNPNAMQVPGGFGIGMPNLFPGGAPGGFGI